MRGRGHMQEAKGLTRSIVFFLFFFSILSIEGALSSADGAVTALAGATWGGGTTVNWCASLQVM